MFGKRCVYCHKKIKRNESCHPIRIGDLAEKMSDVQWKLFMEKDAYQLDTYAHDVCIRLMNIETIVKKIDGSPNFMSREEVEKLIKEIVNKDVVSEW
jgi:hypothetical protein